MKVDIKGYEMVGDDVVSGDSLKNYPPDLMPPYNVRPVGVESGGYDLCCIAWISGGAIRNGIIKVESANEMAV